MGQAIRAWRVMACIVDPYLRTDATPGHVCVHDPSPGRRASDWAAVLVQERGSTRWTSAHQGGGNHGGARRRRRTSSRPRRRPLSRPAPAALLTVPGPPPGLDGDTCSARSDPSACSPRLAARREPGCNDTRRQTRPTRRCSACHSARAAGHEARLAARLDAGRGRSVHHRQRAASLAGARGACQRRPVPRHLASSTCDLPGKASGVGSRQDRRSTRGISQRQGGTRCRRSGRQAPAQPAAAGMISVEQATQPAPRHGPRRRPPPRRLRRAGREAAAGAPPPAAAA